VTRRAVLLILFALVAVVAASQIPKLGPQVERIGLPLEHSTVIRQQAREKGLRPELIAAVIYAETRFNARRSPAGAEGLMQLLPSTAQFIAKRSGGTAFETADLADPEVNIRYGSWYLRYLLQRYDGSELEAVAAYNAGMGNVDRWIAKARSEARQFSESDIGFPETRAYVDRVFGAERDYRSVHGRELGILPAG
jgi:soluble lytic murein transglycosylase